MNNFIEKILEEALHEASSDAKQINGPKGNYLSANTGEQGIVPAGEKNAENNEVKSLGNGMTINMPNGSQMVPAQNNTKNANGENNGQAGPLATLNQALSNNREFTDEDIANILRRPDVKNIIKSKEFLDYLNSINFFESKEYNRLKGPYFKEFQEDPDYGNLYNVEFQDAVVDDYQDNNSDENQNVITGKDGQAKMISGGNETNQDHVSTNPASDLNSISSEKIEVKQDGIKEFFQKYGLNNVDQQTFEKWLNFFNQFNIDEVFNDFNTAEANSNSTTNESKITRKVIVTEDQIKDMVIRCARMIKRNQIN